MGRVDPLSELRQHGDCDLRLLLEQSLEVDTGDRQTTNGRLGPDPSLPRLVREQRELAEELPRAQLPRAAVRGLHLDRPLLEDEHPRAGLAHLDQDPSGWLLEL